MRAYLYQWSGDDLAASCLVDVVVPCLIPPGCLRACVGLDAGWLLRGVMERWMSALHVGAWCMRGEGGGMVCG